jgi:hypothetical protein
MTRRNAAHWAKIRLLGHAQHSRPLGHDPSAGPRPAQPLAAGWCPSGFAGSLATAPTVPGSAIARPRWQRPSPHRRGGLHLVTRAAWGAWDAVRGINWVIWLIVSCDHVARRPSGDDRRVTWPRGDQSASIDA